MFSKLMLSLAVTTSLLLANSAQAQTKQKSTKATTQTKSEATIAAEAKLAADAAAKKAQEEKVLEAKRAEEAKAAADKAALQDQAGVFGYMKSHFSASYHGEYYLTRKNINSANDDDHDMQDLRVMHNPTIIYRPITNWKLLATSEFKYTDATAAGTYINRHFRSLVLLTRENVLTEKENGIKMDIGLGRRIFDRNHGKAASYGNSRINTSLSKKFSDSLSTTLLVQYLGNDPVKRMITAETWRHGLEIIPSFTYQISDKVTYFFNDDIIINTPWQNNTDEKIDISHEMNIGFVSYQWDDKNSSYFQLKYLHGTNTTFADQGSADYFDYYIGHTHNFTPKLSVTGEFGSTFLALRDGRDGFAKAATYPELAFYLDYSL